MKKTLVQIHHQFEDRTEMIVQEEFFGNADLRKRMKELNSSHPLPEGAQWMMCTKSSDFFIPGGTGRVVL